MKQLTWVLWMTSALAWGDVFEYSLKKVPAGGSDCHAQAGELGQQFAKASGAKLVQSLCVGEKKGLRDFVVRYEADEELEVVSTLGRHFSHDPAGRFKTEAECEAELPGVQERFEKATELKAAFAFCTPVAVSHRRPWAPRIDGFGAAKRQHYISGYAIFGVPKGITGKEYRGQVAAALKAEGMIFDALVVHSQMAYARVSVHYYGDEEVDFTLVEHTKTRTKAQCEAQIPQLRAIYSKPLSAPALVYCGHVHVGNQYETNVLYLGELELKTRKSVESYRDFAACEADRERLVRFYQKDLGQDIRGGLCTHLVGESEVKVVLFEPK